MTMDKWSTDPWLLNQREEIASLWDRENRE